MCVSDSSLKRNPQTVWASMTINFGPKTATLLHTDFFNLAFAWCSITALGNFNANGWPVGSMES